MNEGAHIPIAAQASRCAWMLCGECFCCVSAGMSCADTSEARRALTAARGHAARAATRFRFENSLPADTPRQRTPRSPPHATPGR